MPTPDFLASLLLLPRPCQPVRHACRRRHTMLSLPAAILCHHQIEKGCHAPGNWEGVLQLWKGGMCHTESPGRRRSASIATIMPPSSVVEGWPLPRRLGYRPVVFTHCFQLELVA